MSALEPPGAAGGHELLTSPGPAGIAVVRAWGAGAAVFAARHLRGTGGGRAVMRAELIDGAGQAIDDVLLSRHGGGEIRVHLHGSSAVVRACRDFMRSCGLAEAQGPPLWPVQDDIAADLHILLPRMTTRRGARWLVQDAERMRQALIDLEQTADAGAARRSAGELLARRGVFDWFATPLRLAVIGPPNAGKSTLINALADRAVSIVSPTPGTTRDWVEAEGEVGGFPVVWIDTAGLRDPGDEIEQAGVERARRIVSEADALVLVLDGTPEGRATRAQFVAAHTNLAPVSVLLNKRDAGQDESAIDALPAAWRGRVTCVSAAQADGLEAFQLQMLQALGREEALLNQPAPFSAAQIRRIERVAQRG